MSSCAWDGLNFCPISGMLWDGVQVVLAVWLQSPSLRVTSNDVRNMRCRTPLRLSASPNKTRAMLRGWEALTVCDPGSGVEKINLDYDTGDETKECVTDVTWLRQTLSHDTWHSLGSQLAPSHPSSPRIQELRKYTSTARRVTNLVKKAEAVTGAELRVGIVTIYQHHSCPLSSHWPLTVSSPLQSIYLTPLFDSPSLPLNSDSRREFKCPYLMIRSITSRSI